MANRDLTILKSLQSANAELENKLRDTVNEKEVELKREIVEASQYALENLTFKDTRHIKISSDFVVKIRSAYTEIYIDDESWTIYHDEGNDYQNYTFYEMASKIDFMEKCREANFPQALYFYVDDTIKKNIGTEQMRMETLSDLINKVSEI